jgi:hypothetical protein
MKHLLSAIIALVFILSSCSLEQKPIENPDANIVFLHQSTGRNVWLGERELLTKFSSRFEQSTVVKEMDAYNKKSGKKYAIKEQHFIKGGPNQPYDYYNLWVKQAGEELAEGEPTLEMLTKEYDVIVWKHCYPYSHVITSEDSADINSNEKTLANYQLQYNALKEKMRSFPDVTFIVWTAPAVVAGDNTNEEEGKNAKEAVEWTKNVWNEAGDNIFIWDFRSLQTEGGLFLKDEYAKSKTDSHPNPEFSEKAAKLFVKRIIDVIENKGEQTKLTGEPL